MKIAIIGAGALGTLLAGRLAGTDHEIWLLHHSEASAAEIDESGVRIEGEHCEVHETHVRTTAEATAVGPVDLVIVLVRSYETVEAVRQHEAAIGAGTHVLSLQNGLTNHYRLREHVGPDRVLSGVSYQGASLERPGTVVHTADGPLVFGGEDTAFAKRVGDIFESAGVATNVVGDPFPHIWEKLLWSVAIKPVAALTRLPNGELVGTAATRDIMHRLMVEASRVAAAHGVTLDADGIFDDLLVALEGSTHRSSMLADVERSRRTEIDDVNGAIVELAEDEGIDVPYNEMITGVVHGLEQGYLSS